MLTSFVNLISKVTDAESFRIITLAMLLAIGMMFLYGFRHLEGRIDKRTAKSMFASTLLNVPLYPVTSSCRWNGA
jgi:high-affinity Fe2+/Pb2+ permease